MKGAKDYNITQLIHSQSPIQRPSCLEDEFFLILQRAPRISQGPLHYPTLQNQLLQACPEVQNIA